MSNMQRIGWGVLACLASANWAAAEPRIDPPSPPPYCADGRCYPKSTTWGFYQGRWRTWPGVDAGPTGPGAEPTPADVLGDDLKPYEPPSPEEEDLRAPPPTRTRETRTAPTSPPPSVEGTPQETPTGEEKPSERVIMPIPPSNVRPPSVGDADAPPPLPFETPPGSSPYDSVPPLPPVGTPLLPDEVPAGPLPNIPGELPLEPEMHLRRGPIHNFPADDPPPPLPSTLRSLASS